MQIYFIIYVIQNSGIQCFQIEIYDFKSQCTYTFPSII